MNLIERMRLLEVDHTPVGWPAVQMQDITALLDTIERLRVYLEGYANCPCCDTNDVCLDGCTFAEDFPEDNQRMLNVRELLGVT